ncbi:acyl-CoA dehydrogenase family protein [Parasphingorhabdus sp.]|uniref:acyl-CoA dehydrogenase family protein n=1 Tax=Parasphingorhabdus sp. TaxID=2709688 RepID=UPI002F95A7B0
MNATANNSAGATSMNLELPEEHRAFKDMVDSFVAAELPKDWARELERKEHEYPFELWDKFTKAGFHGLGIDEEYGGIGGDILMQMTLARSLARTLGGLAWIWGLTSFAGVKSIGLYGTEEQKRKFLPEIAAGKLRAAISFTEPGGGTDVLGALRTTATQVEGGWKINGEKIWSSSAHVADYLLVLARSDKNVEKNHHGVTLFWVPAKSDGITCTELAKLGMRSMGSCSVHFDDVFVPDNLVLGEPNNAWRTLLPTLNNERMMVSAFCLGVIDGVLEDALDYAKTRKAYNRPIGQFQAIQHMIADIRIAQYQVETMLIDCAWKLSVGRDQLDEVTALKVVASEQANKCADLGIQILGGMGYSAETDMQRYWRDSRLWRIGPITNEMARNVIGECMGLPRSF